METRREEATNEHVQNIRSGMPIMKSLYGLTVDEYDYIDSAIDALRDIKHFGITEYYVLTPVNAEGYANLPCNATIIDAVTTAKMGQKVFHDRFYVEMWCTL